MKTITVKVTQEHIDNGVLRSCRACPVALALIDTGYSEVAVSADGLYISDSFGRLEVPPTVANFIKAFDLGYHPRPFEFTLEVPW